MGGKRQANILSSIITNFQTVEDVIESSSNASGSAMAENEKYLDSIQGKIDQFNNAVQTMWMNFLNDEVVKWIVQFGTGLVKLVDQFGLLNIAVGAFTAVKTIGFKGLKEELDAINKDSSKVLNIFSKKQDTQGLKNTADAIKGITVAKKAENAVTQEGVMVTEKQTAADAVGQAVRDKDTRSTIANTAATWANVAATKALVIAKNLLKGLAFGIIVGIATDWLTTGLSYLQEHFKSAEEKAKDLKEKVDELTDSYKDAKKEFSGNLEILTITDTEGYDDLLSEFENLAQGVNNLGENVSLTTDEYSRYKEICEAIVGVNPSLAEGYDNATQAISANKGALAQLIELQKEEARLASAEYVSYGAYSKNGNFESMANNAITEYKKVKDKVDDYADETGNNAITGLLENIFDWNDFGEKTYGDQTTSTDDLAQKIMGIIGFEPTKIDEILQSYYNDLGEFDYGKWASDYADKIAQSKKEVVAELEAAKKSGIDLSRKTRQEQEDYAKKVLKHAGYDGWAWWDENNPDNVIKQYTSSDADGIARFNYDAFKIDHADEIERYNRDFYTQSISDFSEWADGMTTSLKKEEAAANGMIDAYLQIPYALKEYDDLGLGAQSFITKWIQNSDMFKIDKNTTQDSILAAEQTIIDTIQSIANGSYTTEVDGKIVSAQTIIDQMMSINESDVNFGEYKESIRTLIERVWDSFDAAAQEVFGDKANLAKMLGFDLVLEGDKEDAGLSNLRQDIERITGLTGEELQKAIDSLPMPTLRAMIQWDWDSTQANSMDFQGMIDAINPVINKDYTNIIQTYSSLSEAIDKVNTALETSKEVFSVGAKVTEDYYNSLVELGISADELSECIDKENGYIVTNVDKLNELLQSQKDAVAWNIKLGKSQAELQYHDVIQSISDQITSTTVLANVNEELINSLFEQANALRATINQYQLLESSLLGATNAFIQFSKAQEIDSQNTYGSTLVEMAQTMYDAIYKTGQVGTEAFWAAVKATVPDDIYMGLAPGEQQIKAISRYLQDNLFSGLTFSGDSFSIDYNSIESFVKKAQSKGLFSGTDTTAFGLSPAFMASLEEGENGLKKFAEQLGVTEEYVYAIFSEMDKYNSNGIGLSMLFQLDTSTTSQLTVLNNQLEQALATRKRLLEQGADLSANTAEISRIQAQQAGVKTLATAKTTSYLMATNALKDPTQKVTDVLSTDLIAEIGLQLTGEEKIEDVFQQISDWLLQLEEPTVLDLEISQESVQNSMDEIEGLFGDEFEAKFKIFNEGDKQGQLTDDEKSALEQYSKLLDMDQLIDTAMSQNLTRTETLLSEIATNTGIMAGTKEAPPKEENTKDGDNSSSGNNTGNDNSTNPPQSEKPAPNTLIADTMNDIMQFRKQITKEQMELSKSGAMNVQQQYAYDSLAEIARQAKAIEDMLIDGAISGEDAQRQFQNLQTQASTFGVTIPVKLKVDQKEASLEVAKTVKGLNVNLNDRNKVPFDEEHFKAWADYYRDVIEHANEYSAEYVAGVKEDLASIERGDSTATVYSQTYYKSDFAENGELAPGEENYAIVLTPILPDGTVISPEALDAYAERIFNGEEIEPNITLGIFDGENFEAEAAQFADDLHESQAELYGLGDAAQETKEELNGIFTMTVPDSEAIKRLQGLSDEDRQKLLAPEEAQLLGFNVEITGQQALDELIARTQTYTSSLYKVKQEGTETYSTLQSQISSYNDIVSQTQEIVSNGTKVTEEYKQSLIALGVDATELGACFDVTTGLIIKDIDALNKLVNTAKKNTANNIKLAKSQAQLRYYELGEEMRAVIGTSKQLDAKQLATINRLYQEMSTVQSTIAKYSLLEAQLLGTANAYDRIAEAQQIDSAIDYGSKAEDLVSILANAFNTGELGTEAARVAFEGLIPDGVIDKSKELNDQMKQAYDYFTKGEISKLFTIEFNKDGSISGVEMTKKNVQSYIEDLIKQGKVFSGSWDNFELDSNIQSMEDFASALGITEEVALALLTTLEKYDISWLGGNMETLIDQLMGDNLEYSIQKSTEKTAKLLQEKAKLLAKDKRSDDEEARLTQINAELEAQNQIIQTNREAASAMWQEYSNSEDAAQALSGLSQDAKLSEEDLNQIFAGIDEETRKQFGLEWNEDTKVEDYLKRVRDMQLALGQPSELVLTLAQDDVESQIKDILGVDSLDDPIALEAQFKFNTETGTYEYQGDKDLTNEQRQQLEGLYGDWTKLRDLLNLPTTEDYAKRSADANERTANAVEALAGQKTEGGAESETGAGNTETTGGDSKKSEITTLHEKPIAIGENQVKLFNDAVKESFSGTTVANAAEMLNNRFKASPIGPYGNSREEQKEIQVAASSVEVEIPNGKSLGQTVIDVISEGIDAATSASIKRSKQNETNGRQSGAGNNPIITPQPGPAPQQTPLPSQIIEADNVIVESSDGGQQGGVGNTPVITPQQTPAPKEPEYPVPQPLQPPPGVKESKIIDMDSSAWQTITDIVSKGIDATTSASIKRSKQGVEVPSLVEQIDDWLTGDGEGQKKKPRKFSSSESGAEDSKPRAGGAGGDGVADLTNQVKELNSASQEATNGAYDMWKAYTENDAALRGLQSLQDSSRILNQEQAAYFGIELDEDEYITVGDAIQQLIDKKRELEEPTVITAESAISEIDTQIQTLKEALESGDLSQVDPVSVDLEVGEVPTEEDIKNKIESLEKDKVALALAFGIELNPDDINTLTVQFEYLNSLSMDKKEVPIETTGADTAMSILQKINNYKIADKSYNVRENIISSGSGGTGIQSEHTTGGGRYTVAVNGTAHAQGTGSWGAPKSETSLAGELGPEMRVRGNKWSLIGQNGAEFTDVRKGDIIFNHKQTESLLKNGYVTGRGKAYAEGTIGGSAYANIDTWMGGYNKLGKDYSNTGNSASKLSKAADDLSKAADELSDDFEEIFDWIEVRIEEITETIDLMSAKLENAIGSISQNAVIDDMIHMNRQLYDNLIAGANEYYAFSAKLLEKVPAQYREMAQDGTIAIESFTGTVGEEALTAIQDYREWVQKGADMTQQAEETLTEISNLAKQAIDNIASDYENKKSFSTIKIDQYEAYNSLLETSVGAESAKIYEQMIRENNKNIAVLQEQRGKMQAELNKQVEAGNIKKYSQNWYDAINDIAAVDTEIINLTTDTKDYQDTINELHWEHFDNLLSRIEAISNEANNLIDVLGAKDLVDKDTAEWTDEGITSLGLYAQQLEVTEMQAKKYREEIAYLNKNWKKLGYTEQEYVEKLEELKEGQYDAIKAYNDTKDAIVDLNRERVDAIKDGIQKEIDAYEELISKKKEELDSEKDLYDFQKGVADQQKDIADIERKLAALSADNSATARAERARLQAELAEAQQQLEETYYDRSVTKQQEALDKELENFQDAKNEEMEQWDEYLENTEQVVADSLATIQANTDIVYQTLQSMGQEYSLSIADALTSPWIDGESAIQSYSEKFGLTMSSTVDELRKVADEYKEIMDEIEGYGDQIVNRVNENVNTYQGANPQPEKQKIAPETPAKTIKVGSQINAGSAKIYGYAGDKSGEKQSYSNDPIYKVLSIQGDWLLVRHHKLSSGTTGWFKKGDVKAYAQGTTGVNKDQLAWIDEMGLEELVMHAGPNGRLQYLTKGTSVIPSDISDNLMEWGTLDPQNMLDQNRPVISSPHTTNNNIELNMNIDSVVRVDTVTQDTIPDLTKTINKELDKYMKGLNSQIRKYVR